MEQLERYLRTEEVNDRIIQRALREIDTEELVDAMVGLGEEGREIVCRNLSRRVFELLKEDIRKRESALPEGSGRVRIARELDGPEGTVKYLCYDLRRRLARILKGDGQGPVCTESGSAGARRMSAWELEVMYDRIRGSQLLRLVLHLQDQVVQDVELFLPVLLLDAAHARKLHLGVPPHGFAGPAAQVGLPGFVQVVHDEPLCAVVELEVDEELGQPEDGLQQRCVNRSSAHAPSIA